MGKSKAVDPRTRKTKRAIRNALASLLSEKDVNEITVRDIAELAEINRKTFYRYYKGIYQVVDEIENEVVMAFESLLGEFDFKRDLKDPCRTFERLTATINHDLDFYGHLLSMQGNVSLVSKLVAMLKEKAKKTLLKQVEISERIADVALEYSITGMVSAYQLWFNSGSRQSIEEISEIISTMSFRGLGGILEQYK